jgi:thiamine pyrophosphokinase
MEGTAFIFLNGFYPRGDDLFFRRLIRQTRPRPTLIAVDGGIAFLQKNTVKPDIWISDLDSAPRIRKGFLKNVEVILYPADKEKTDAELAIDLCAKQGLVNITVFGWESRQGETDHLLGSLFLCRNFKGNKRLLRIKYINSRQEIIALKNETRTIRKYKGRRLSVIPISSKIVLTLTGTKYRAHKLTIREGETVSLRNRITADRATINIKGSGLAIIAAATPEA